MDSKVCFGQFKPSSIDTCNKITYQVADVADQTMMVTTETKHFIMQVCEPYIFIVYCYDIIKTVQGQTYEAENLDWILIKPSR